MKRSGAWLIRYALEQLGVRFTFGIPGVHITELYDELNSSPSITPILVNHEGGGAFMADAISRTSEQVGVLTIVPGAGVTHSASGIGEAFLDGVPMLIISGGVRNDTGTRYQLHDVDHQKLIGGICKRVYKIGHQREIVPTLFEAYNLACEGEPGPVFVEVPVNLQLFTAEVDELPTELDRTSPQAPNDTDITRAASLLAESQQVGIFAGWGARDAGAQLVKLAEILNAPVATTLQGLSVFPADHPLHAGFGFGRSAVPAAREAFKNVDCLLAVGTRFGEIGTGSYGIEVPEHLIHIDINPDAIGANYPAEIGLPGDAGDTLTRLLQQMPTPPAPNRSDISGLIARHKQQYRQEWMDHDSGDRIHPLRFFDALREMLPDDGILVLDDGNHTFLAAELFPVHQSKCAISPTDFNCMGYAVPAAIGAKLANPEQKVVAVVGDGCFNMTCMEILTATRLGLDVIYFVFNDGQLAQISQAQKIPYNRMPCTELTSVGYRALAEALGCRFVSLQRNEGIQKAVAEAFDVSAKGPVIVDVNIDYSKATAFTSGTVKTNFGRFDFGTKMRFLGRSVKRRVWG